MPLACLNVRTLTKGCCSRRVSRLWLTHLNVEASRNHTPIKGRSLSRRHTGLRKSREFRVNFTIFGSQGAAACEAASGQGRKQNRRHFKAIMCTNRLVAVCHKLVERTVDSTEVLLLFTVTQLTRQKTSKGYSGRKTPAF